MISHATKKMGLEATHILLLREPGRDIGRQRVLSFFAKNFLVKYDSVKVIEERSFSADQANFWKVVEEGTGNNRRILKKLSAELAEAGFTGINDLPRIPQGYASKTLHTITHLLDGFFGIDTSFYNLEEDSHWLSDHLTATIRDRPEEFQVITVVCSSQSGSSADFLAKLRKFETGF